MVQARRSSGWAGQDHPGVGDRSKANDLDRRLAVTDVLVDEEVLLPRLEVHGVHLEERPATHSGCYPEFVAGHVAERSGVERDRFDLERLRDLDLVLGDGSSGAMGPGTVLTGGWQAAAASRATTGKSDARMERVTEPSR
jgi:hypothetical protein